jgi:uncharacterized protein (TIGR02145 family)
MGTFIKTILIILVIVSISQCKKDTPPSVPYFSIKSVFAAGVHCYATISDDGGANIVERGFKWKTDQEADYQNSKIGFNNGLNYFETTISYLSPGTTYYVKAYAINSKGITYSEEKKITTSRIGNFTDNRDGRTYKWVEIGNQIWMAENLSFLPYISPFTNDTGIFVYNYKGSSVTEAKNQKEYRKYGCLYTWEISLQICPEEWHLPSEDEWQELEKSIGMTQRQISGAENNNIYTAGLLKSSDWSNQANNVTLFSALPGGHHFHDTSNNLEVYFYGLGTVANFWSSTSDDFAYNMTIDPNNNIVNYMASKDHGYSVRCLKDK